MSYEIGIISKGRADSVLTRDIIDQWERITIFVNTDEEREEYQRHNPDIKIVSTGKNGVTVNRNAMLDHYPIGTHLVMMDDDIEGIYAKFGNHTHKHFQITNHAIHLLIERGFAWCISKDTKLWGVNPCAGGGIMLKHQVSFFNFCIGTFCGVIVSDLRHDETIPLKEDYDFTMQHILKFGHIIRFDQYHPVAKHYTNKGGCVDYRNTEKEQQAISRLIEKYPDAFRPHHKRENEVRMHYKSGSRKRYVTVEHWDHYKEEATDGDKT